ncbi:RabGAP/TBC [Armillaria mellea]|nr:RabGAP/TBC [Armillaria mellea]
MEAPAVVLASSSKHHSATLAPSPFSSATTSRTSSFADSRYSTVKAPRQSSETAIVSIYSMYGDDHGRNSWAASHALSTDMAKTMIPQVTLALPEGTLDDDFDTELAYYNTDRPPLIEFTDVAPKTNGSPIVHSSYSRPVSSSATPSSFMSDYSGGHDSSGQFRSSDVTDLSLPSTMSQSEENYPSPPNPRCLSGVSYSSPNRKSTNSARETLSPKPTSASSSPSQSSERATTPVPADRLTANSISPILPLKHPLETTLQSKTSLVPSEGEDMDAFHVRNTYAQLDMSGVKGDGYEEGVERTRARIGASRASQLCAEAALGDGTEKSKELDEQEIQTLANVDRYGFFNVPSHDRLILLPAAPLLKRLSRTTAGPPSASTSATSLDSLPPTPTPAKEASRIAKWNRMLEPEQRDEGANVQIWRVKPSKGLKLLERTYKGIPDRWRSAVWELLLRRFSRTGNAETTKLCQDYRNALDKPSSYDIQIDLDVPRTIGGHIMFRTRYGAGQRSLFHVLHCFSLRCSQCGYVQGMGPIAATLLCYFDPERVYASLVRLHDSYALHNIFSPGFPGLLEAIYVQERITEHMMPDVYAAFEKHMISTTSYATKWYITLFANSVPFQMQLRLWDAFLLEGQDLFIAVAVCIVWVYRDHITSANANFETVLSLLSSFFVPEDENAVLLWIEKTLGDKKLRSNMTKWRLDWRRLVAEGKDASALL